MVLLARPAISDAVAAEAVGLGHPLVAMEDFLAVEAEEWATLPPVLAEETEPTVK